MKLSKDMFETIIKKMEDMKYFCKEDFGSQRDDVLELERMALVYGFDVDMVEKLYFEKNKAKVGKFFYRYISEIEDKKRLQYFLDDLIVEKPNAFNKHEKQICLNPHSISKYGLSEEDATGICFTDEFGELFWWGEFFPFGNLYNSSEINIKGIVKKIYKVPTQR